MKQVATYIFLIVFSLSASQANGQSLKQCKTYAVLIKDASISIDPRIEFFQIFNLMSGNPNVSSVETSYKTAIIDYFQKYHDHPSLVYYRSNFQKFFNSIDAPYFFLLSLKEDFTFRNDLVHNDLQTREGIDTLLNVFLEFARDTDFAAFFNSQKNFYELLLTNTTYALADFDERKRMLDYYGIDQKAPHEFHVVLNTLGMGNFGVGIESNETMEHYAVVSTGISANEIPVYSKNELERLVWHEFGHSFTNELVVKYWDDIEKLNELVEPIEESMQAQAYYSWETVMFEHITRAVSCRLAANKYGEHYAEINSKRLELGRRFIYCEPIIQALLEYENSRNLYHTLDSFIPVIINRLASVSEDSIMLWLDMVEQIRQSGVDDIPESSDFFESKNQLIILSTAEDDLDSDHKLKEYLDNSFPNIPTMADTTALEKDLSGYDLLVIGTPWGNKFIEKYISDIPIKITSEQLITNKIYQGNGYAFMTGWIHPQNPSRVMTMYISQNPKDLVNFAWVKRGGTDYHIMKNLITLKAGNYCRIMKMWLCN